MRTGTIYRFVCKTTGKFIVGSALSYKRRQDYYWSYLRRGKWNNPYVQACYNKYGGNSMQFEVLQSNVPEEILGKVESVWIGALKARAEDHGLGMNMRDGDRFRLSQESRAKILETYRTKDWPKRNLNKIHPIYQYTKLGDFIKEWRNPREVADHFNLNLVSIHKCCTRNKSEKKYSLHGNIYSYINHK